MHLGYPPGKEKVAAETKTKIDKFLKDTNAGASIIFLIIDADTDQAALSYGVKGNPVELITALVTLFKEDPHAVMIFTAALEISKQS